MKIKDLIYNEPVNIQLAESRTIPKDGTIKIFTFGHAVEASKLKLLIEFTVYYLVEKDEEVLPFLKYFYDTEKQG